MRFDVDDFSGGMSTAESARARLKPGRGTEAFASRHGGFTVALRQAREGGPGNCRLTWTVRARALGDHASSFDARGPADDVRPPGLPLVIRESTSPRSRRARCRSSGYPGSCSGIRSGCTRSAATSRGLRPATALSLGWGQSRCRTLNGESPCFGRRWAQGGRSRAEERLAQRIHFSTEALDRIVIFRPS